MIVLLALALMVFLGLSVMMFAAKFLLGAVLFGAVTALVGFALMRYVAEDHR